MLTIIVGSVQSLILIFKINPLVYDYGSRIGIIGYNLNELSAFQALTASLLYSHLLYNRFRLNILNIIKLFFLIMIVTSTLLPASRGGSLALLFGFSMASLLVFKHQLSLRVLILIPLVGISIYYSFINTEYLIERFANRDIFSEEEGRYLIYLNSFSLFSENPLFGLGGVYTYELGKLMDKGVIAAHNTYMQILLSFGLVGLIIFLSFIINAIKKVLNSNQSELKVMLSTLLITSLFSLLFTNWASDKFIWVIFAFAVRYSDSVQNIKDLPITNRFKQFKHNPIGHKNYLHKV